MEKKEAKDGLNKTNQRGKRYKVKWYQKLKLFRILALTIILSIIILFVHNYLEKRELASNEMEAKSIKLERELKETTDRVLELQNQLIDVNKRLKETESEVTSRGNVERTVDIQPQQSKSSNYKAVTATAYCSCVKCCGKSDGITASGTKAKAGRTVAASSSYRFGTKIEIKGMGTYVVEDRGGPNIEKKGYIDIYFDSHEEALKFGKKTIYIKIL